jgi:hypothetical protein
MNLLGSAGDSKHKDSYWITLDAALTGPGELPMLTYRSRLDSALRDLGKLDYEITTSLDRLRCDLTTETYDHLHGQISALIEPEIKTAVAGLAKALGNASTLMDELISEPPSAQFRD